MEPCWPSLAGARGGTQIPGCFSGGGNEEHGGAPRVGRPDPSSTPHSIQVPQGQASRSLLSLLKGRTCIHPWMDCVPCCAAQSVLPWLRSSFDVPSHGDRTTELIGDVSLSNCSDQYFHKQCGAMRPSSRFTLFLRYKPSSKYSARASHTRRPALSATPA